MSESPAQLSALEAARRIADGRLTSEELVHAWLQRIRQVEPAVQAGQLLGWERALGQLPAGQTRQAHSPEHTPGGSSSGSAAAVAAQMVPLALGSQTARSVIRPGAFCGDYAFKPTHGLIPRTGVLQLSRTLDHIGLFARSIEDLALLAEELAGYDERDPDTRPRARIPFQSISSEEPPIEPKLAFIRTPHWERTDPD